MTGTAMLIFACGFFIYAVSPSYANETSEVNKPQMESGSYTSAVVYNGYLYCWATPDFMYHWANGKDEYVGGSYTNDHRPKKRKLP